MTKQLPRELKVSGFLVERLPKILLGLGILNFFISFLLYFKDTKHFFFSYLTSYVFFLTLTLGSFFIVMILFVTRAGWAVVIRRIPEFLMKNVGLMFLLFIPILFGFHDLYHWSDSHAVSTDHILHGKVPYLNIPFFVIRYFVFFGLWGWLITQFFKFSNQQDDSGDETLTLRCQKMATYGILIYALSQSFAFIDWVMSLTPHWYSTIFGVYFFAGSVVVGFTTITVLLMVLRKFGYLREFVTVEHYHDLGKLAYGFNIFWSYIAFSQFFLIWYANIPEETVFFAEHLQNNWNSVAVLLCVGHFFIPFVFFMSRHMKRILKLHLGMCFWLIFMHFVDIYWIIMPNFSDRFHLSLVDVTCFFAIGCVFFSVFFFSIETI